jgi:tripartite-type tricarboxylate transporter receptor subunit TctC
MRLNKLAAIAVAVLAAGGTAAAAENYPSRPISVIVPFPAGGRPTRSRAFSRSG